MSESTPAECPDVNWLAVRMVPAYALISKRYEKASTIITSNKEFQEWGSIFNDDVIATAILDRLLHHSHPFLINGPSYRMKDLLPTTKNKKQTTEKNNEI